MSGLNLASMQKKTINVDNGVNFGMWEDETSDYLYRRSIRQILDQIHVPSSVGDYGGGNGLIKQYIPHAVTIDKDKEKQPDVLQNILEHEGFYDLGILRYVLHYLNDYEVMELFSKMNCLKVLVIQFTNQDLHVKYHNSKNEFKYFRTKEQLEALLPVKAKHIFSGEYRCTNEFYKNRLQLDNSISHLEQLQAYII